MSSRADKRERTRDTIMRAAHELFARDGFAATTLPAIAAAAGVSPRTVSAAFRTKEAIVFERYPAAVARLRDRLAVGTPPLEALDAWITTDLAPLRVAAVSTDAELWCIERRELRGAAELVAAAVAATAGCGIAAARVAAAAALAALLESDAASHDAALSFARAGFATL